MIFYAMFLPCEKFTKMKKYIYLVVLSILISWTLTHAQNVGVGTTTPAEKLHVAGNIKGDTVKPEVLKILTNASVGKVLTSDAVGNALWQTNNAATGGNIGFGVWGDCATNGNITEYNPVADATGVANNAFGYTVSISGNYAIVGSFGDNSSQGSANIYQYNGSNWVFIQKLTDATGAANDYFGISVFISGNYAMVGSYRDDVGVNLDQGSVSIFQFDGTSSWVFKQKLTDATGAAADYFGVSVSLSGNYLIVGANGDDGGAGIDQGSVIFYQYSGGSWVFMQKITDVTGAANDYFGSSVSLSGTYAIVGALFDDVGAITNQGSASIYQFNGATWVFRQKITDATGDYFDNFGTSVSISGNYAVVGINGDEVGSNSGQGSASIYQFNGSNWVLMQKITEISGAASDNFGISVAISDNYVIVGANQSVTNRGSATIFLKVGNGWQKLQHITDPGGNSNDNFAFATAIDGITKQFFIGAYGYVNNTGKVVFGKIN